MSKSHRITLDQAVRGITSFIEVATHTILYTRHIYPAQIFTRCRVYDTVAYQSRHPTLNKYIKGALDAVADELEQGTVDNVVVVIKDKEHRPIERFIFSMENMFRLDEVEETDESFEDSLSSASYGEYFKAFIVKITMIESMLGPLNLGENASFAIVIEMRTDDPPSVRNEADDPPPWSPAEYKLSTHASKKESELSVLQSLHTGVINMTMGVQETKFKLHPEKYPLQQTLEEAASKPATPTVSSKNTTKSNSTPDAPSSSQPPAPSSSSPADTSKTQSKGPGKTAKRVRILLD
ncbi:DNA-binding protein [Cylindrobasidium torrendii FP15055 ss-10]|uniref:DNA-binding protein n=1 Tax=Cylindrobasidium torrendii FP15055 ss-10 TaxID=1314674 RepID=A0A0D7BHM0_9AGAR|nr:DNA-binding protein [Cylindrobasidium torrendii FP15055 ss-10]